MPLPTAVVRALRGGWNPPGAFEPVQVGLVRGLVGRRGWVGWWTGELNVDAACHTVLARGVLYELMLHTYIHTYIHISMYVNPLE